MYFFWFDLRHISKLFAWSRFIVNFNKFCELISNLTMPHDVADSTGTGPVATLLGPAWQWQKSKHRRGEGHVLNIWLDGTYFVIGRYGLCALCIVYISGRMCVDTQHTHTHTHTLSTKLGLVEYLSGFKTFVTFLFLSYFVAESAELGFYCFGYQRSALLKNSIAVGSRRIHINCEPPSLTQPSFTAIGWLPQQQQFTFKWR